MQAKEYNREELDYHQSENHYTLLIPKRFLDAKNIKVLRKNADGNYSEANVIIREQDHDILLIMSVPMDIRIETVGQEID